MAIASFVLSLFICVPIAVVVGLVLGIIALRRTSQTGQRGRGFAIAGVVIYGILAFFQFVTLPVEWDASRRAKQQLLSMGIVQRDEAQAEALRRNIALMKQWAKEGK